MASVRLPQRAPSGDAQNFGAGSNGRFSILKISETGPTRFRGVRFQTPNSVSEFRGANSVSSFQPLIYLCVNANSLSSSQNSPSLPPNSVRLSEVFFVRNSTLETVYIPSVSENPLENSPLQGDPGSVCFCSMSAFSLVPRGTGLKLLSLADVSDISYFPRDASTLIYKIRSCIARTDLWNKHEISRECLIFKIQSCNARSDLKNKSAIASLGYFCFGGGEKGGGIRAGGGVSVCYWK